jgi:nucleoside-diphosphate kinase
MERSLILVKPDGTKRGLTGTILAYFEKQGLTLVALRMLHMDKELAQKHYAVHKEKPFFGELVDYITSGPIVAAVFEGQNAVENIRKIMGSTDPAKAPKGTIRGDLGLDLQRNTVHGSDAVATAQKEIKLFFTDKEIYNFK